MLYYFQDNLIEGKLFFIKQFQLINVKRILKVEHYHFGKPNKIIGPENDHQCLLKPLGKMFTGSFLNGRIRLKASELTHNFNATSGICRYADTICLLVCCNRKYTVLCMNYSCQKNRT